MITGVEIAVRDLARAERFYGGLLGFADERVRLVGGTADDGWVDDDRQLGNRHLAFYVPDVDAEAARLREAGVEFTVEPQDATGDVRLAFFLDPDGTSLELLSGPPRYTRSYAPEDVSLPAPGDPPALAHLAITVEQPPRNGLVGELDVDDMVLSFVTGPVPLELFSFPDGELLPEANGNLRAVHTRR
jgi:catechol 2,3-dioxygenase-like lactoylglutathione lyase family enzyme